LEKEVEYLLGIEGGTECIKAGIYDLDGNLISIADFKYETIHEHPGWAEQKVEQWREGLIKSVKSALASAKIKGTDICGISGDATCCSVIFLDENSNPVRNPIIWMDVRASEEAKLLDSIEDPAKKYNGYSSVSPEWFPCKILWFKNNQPELYKKTKIIAEYTDWIMHELTGNWNLGISTATVRGYYDNRSGGWPLKYYKKMGLEDLFEKLPKKVLRVGDYVGGLRKDIAELTGLNPGTPVAEGAFDAACGIIGSNAFSNGQIFLIAGSSNYVQLHIDKEFHAKGIFGTYPDMIIDNFAIEGGQTSTGTVMKWFKHNFINSQIEENAKAKGMDIYPFMDSEAAKIPIGSEGLIVVEHFQGNRTPFIDPKSRGIFAGLSLKHTPAHIYRAIMEAAAYDTEATLQVIKKNNFKLNEIIACGGQMKSKIWSQIYADVIGIPIKLNTNPEATTLGAAILGGLAAGKYKSLKKAAEKMAKFQDIIKPNIANHKKYKGFVDSYINTYKSARKNIYRTNLLANQI
jgi:FGGY-family pentulose kinase